MTIRHAYPPSFGPDHESPFVRMSWALMDQLKPEAMNVESRFLLGSLIAGALSEAFKIGRERRDAEDILREHPSYGKPKSPKGH